MSGLALLAGLSLLVSPGGWLAVAWPPRAGTWRARLVLAGAMSPCIAVAQWYALRLAGVPVDAAAWSLVAVNALALWPLVARCRADAAAAPARRVDPWTGALLAIFIAIITVPWFTDHVLRIFNFHAWLHTSIAQQFSAGALLPEEPEIAGLRLAYPWLGHVYWAALSTVTGRPHTQLYPFTDIAALVWTCLAVLETSAVVGAGVVAARVGLVWMVLGTNVASYWSTLVSDRMIGDIRYTPFLRKFMISELSAFVIAMLAVLGMTGAMAVRSRHRALLAIAAAVTAGIGAFYAILAPAALALSGLVALAVWFDGPAGDRVGARVSAGGFAVALAAAAALAAWYLGLVTGARAGAPLHLSSPGTVLSKLATGAIAAAPFIAVTVVGLGRQWRRADVLVLLGAAGTCYLLRPLVTLGGYGEYKFMFPMMLFLTPVAALALEQRVPRRWLGHGLVAASVVLLVPAATARFQGWGDVLRAEYPAIVESGTGLALDDRADEAGWVRAVRDGTPPDTIVAVRRARFLLPVLTGRSLVAPAEETHGPQPGYWELSRFNLADLRGYGAAIVDERQQLLLSAYAPTEATAATTLAALQALGRPVAIVYEPGDATAFADSLRRSGAGREIFHDAAGRAVWLIPAPAGAAGDAAR